MTAEVLPWSILIARMGVALLAGAAIGWDRRRTGKPAGMRTHMLVSLGSCLFVLVPLDLGAGTEALSRIIPGVATGIGFLGAGEIIHRARNEEKKATVKGLTSAAATWFTAAMGIAAGCGLWKVVFLALASALVTLVVIKVLERWLFEKAQEDDDP
jgi:putative Mg2+ transporter-C (MgtC) family protein